MPVLKNFRLSAMLLTLIIVSIFSCKKDDTTDFVKQAEIAAEYAKAEDNMADIFVLFHKALHDSALINNGVAKIDSALVNYSQNGGSTVAQFSFDFGNDGIACPDGKYRKGQISAVLTQSFDQPDAVFTANFANIMVDSTLMQGQFFYKNTGDTVAGQLKFEIAMEVSFYSKHNKYLTLASQRDIFWKTGFDKPYNTVNHVFRIPGSASANYFGYDGAANPLVNIEATFTEEWIIQLSCLHHVSKGSFEISLDDGQKTEILTGEFIDVDEDNCADKIFIKNTGNSFGYPLYL